MKSFVSKLKPAQNSCELSARRNPSKIVVDHIFTSFFLFKPIKKGTRNYKRFRTRITNWSWTVKLVFARPNLSWVILKFAGRRCSVRGSPRVTTCGTERDNYSVGCMRTTWRTAADRLSRSTAYGFVVAPAGRLSGWERRHFSDSDTRVSLFLLPFRFFLQLKTIVIRIILLINTRKNEISKEQELSRQICPFMVLIKYSYNLMILKNETWTINFQIKNLNFKHFY